MSGVRPPDVPLGDDARHDGHILQQLGGAGSRHHHLVEHHRILFQAEIHRIVPGAADGLRRIEITDVGCRQRITPVIRQPQFVTSFGIRYRTECRTLFYHNGSSR